MVGPLTPRGEVGKMRPSTGASVFAHPVAAAVTPSGNLMSLRRIRYDAASPLSILPWPEPVAAPAPDAIPMV